MAKEHKTFYLEEEYTAKLKKMTDLLTKLNGGKKISEATVVELLLALVDDNDFNIDGTTLETLVLGYYTTTFKNKRIDRRKNNG